MERKLDQVIIESSKLDLIVNENTLILLKILLGLVGNSVVLSIVYCSIFKSWVYIVGSIVLGLIITVASLLIYRMISMRLITRSSIEYNNLLFLEKNKQYLKDIILLKNLSIIDVSDIRNEENRKEVDDISKSIETIEGTRLMKRILKNNGYINYKLEENERTD